MISSIGCTRTVSSPIRSATSSRHSTFIHSPSPCTVAHHSKWHTDRLTRECEGRQTSVLQTEHNKGRNAAIEFSLTSPTFQELGPDARALLGVVAFFPQDIIESNLEWLFPTVSDGTGVLDEFSITSMTHRSNGFILQHSGIVSLPRIQSRPHFSVHLSNATSPGCQSN